jgi:AmmeMemoRadiSam system protein A
MSQPLENLLHSSRRSAPNEFTIEERRILLEVAHKSILAAYDNVRINVEAPSEHLAQLRGAFTTIYLHGELHGCVGYVFPVASLYRTVADTARAAAFEDTRFAPLTRDQANELTISLSILSALEPINAEDLEIGRHGLLITLGAHRGLLLPQVPVEHGWDRITFLQQTCRKAGLSADAWQQGATLEGFTAEIFGDDDVH